MLLEEFDYDKNAILNPDDLSKPIKGFPAIAVSCFSYITFNRLVSATNAVKIAEVELSNLTLPVYKTVYKDKEIALFMSHVGGAGCVAVIEELFALGVEKLVLFGTCGVLDGSIEDCSIIVPNIAMRDEGTSFHYMPPSDEMAVNIKYGEEFKKLLDEFGCSYTEGKVWTTDACYRETKEKTLRRRNQGCICVDMECSAVAALADFRGKDVLHFFYAADNLDSETWDARSLSNSSKISEKDKISILAIEMAARMI